MEPPQVDELFEDDAAPSLFTDEIAPERRRGRGAARNPAVRYDRLTTGRTDDGWDREDDAPPVRTEVIRDASRSIIARNTSPDLPFDRSVNPYRGCEHGCIYCFARPSHAQLGLSPGLDFETRLVVKPRAAALLETALRRPGYRPAPLAIGTNTDAYQPIDREHGIMRELLEVLWAYRHPLFITTKGAHLTRDIDLLGRMGRAGLLQVAISLTTLDTRLSRAMEPRAAAPPRRLRLMRALAQAGVPVQVNTSPIIPALNDHEIERLIAAAAEAGASKVSYSVLRLPQEVSGLFQDWLAREYPDRAARVMGKVRELHGGRDYDPQWGKRMRGEGVYAQLISRRVRAAAARHGLDRALPALRCDLFRAPPRAGDQLALPL
ncbi:PA0069 family radical SAM protein [Paralimibaculum aggregatum]|uniref:PA0069 family radical SAM protein n=1 Tax=Paralimibaculum aggregatum TaxID=3036245 RepID=A0ABQ6LQI5_9RHOB|nr:PA0069 family radical SAM protein [Limibaculum sp. NKW23]GMG82971.1 PA0069 family radical SAM protein [Limibaculum sp. NKW23]